MMKKNDYRTFRKKVRYRSGVFVIYYPVYRRVWGPLWVRISKLDFSPRFRISFR